MRPARADEGSGRRTWAVASSTALPAARRLAAAAAAAPMPPGTDAAASARVAAPPRAPSPSLYVAIFGSWVAALAWFHPRLASLLEMAESPLGWGAIAFFVAFTEVAWLYAFFNLGVLAFAAVDRRWRPTPAAAPAVAARPPVAVLYTTCNDFVEQSALSCVRQDYPDFTVYVLDDSSDPLFRARVDRFAAAHPDRVRVVRRGDRRGFKAGNLNHALGRAAREPLFALADADEILPQDFLARTVPLLLAEERRGFVQASHRCNPETGGSFARALGPGIDTHWRWYQPLRNRFGFVMLLGHGALVRRAAWEEVGGFPEIVSEDLGFALRLREKGWRGHFAEEVVCLEDFPESPRAFRVRHMKWTRGTCEFLSKEMGRLLLSRRIPLVEKLDVLFPTLNLPLSLLFFLFVVDANVLLVWLFGRPSPVTVVVAGTELVLPATQLDPRFQAVMGADFFLVTLLTLVAPVLCFVLDMWRTPLKLLRFLGRSTAVYGTLGPLSSLGVLLYVATGKAVFHVTADPTPGAAPRNAGSRWKRLRDGTRALLAGSHPDRASVQVFEIACGVGFGLTCLRTLQVSFFGLALGFVLLPLAHRLGWDNPLVRALVHVPFAFVLLGVAVGGLSLFGLQTVLFGYGFHF